MLPPGSAVGYSAAMRNLLPPILFFATFAFALGITLPLVRVEVMLVFSEEPSLVGMIAGLWSASDHLLAIIVALFSVVFPTAKLMLLYVAAFAGPSGAQTLPGWFQALAKWSMLDVLLVAIVVFAAKTSGFAKAFTQPGLWFFAASVLLTAAASALAKQKTPE